MTGSATGTLGDAEIGVIISTFLFGMATLQMFHYYRNFQQDSKALRVAVMILWFLDLGHTLCSLYGVYSWTIVSFGQPLSDFVTLPRGILYAKPFSSGTMVLVQSFFCYRILRLSGRPLLYLPCIALVVAQFICNTMQVAHLWNDRSLDAFRTTMYGLMVASNAIGPAADMSISVAMCYSLWQVRKASPFHRSQRMVDTLILWTVETTLVTGVCATLLLTLFLSRSDSLWAAFSLFLPNLFSNSMLAALNGRMRWREDEEQDVVSRGLNFHVSGPTSQLQPRRLGTGHILSSAAVESGIRNPRMR